MTKTKSTKQIVDNLSLTPEGKRVIPFTGQFNSIAPFDLEEIMEWLDDYEYLSKTGKKFRDIFWETFVKQDD